MRTAKSDEISLLGYCMGGTLTSIYAALHPHMPIRNLIFMTSPLISLKQDYMVLY